MSHILDTPHPTHTILRGNIYYLNVRVPKEQQQLYGRVVRSRLSDDRNAAAQLADHIVSVLRETWRTGSSSKVDVETLVSSAKPKTFLMSDLVDEYVRVRQIDPSPVFVATRLLYEVVGDRDVRHYSREDARTFLHHLQASGNKTSTLRKRLVCIGAVLNYAYQELEIEKRNPFSKMTIVGEGKDAVKRGSFTDEQLLEGYKQALLSTSNVQLLFPILGETGCRLAEVVGLRLEDVDLENRVLHLRPNTHRRLKTSGSERSIPLSSMACAALTKALQHSDDEWVFPRYIKEDGCYATHASNALAKWMKRRWGMTAHSLRHTFRDRLRAAEVPLEAIDQLGGWSSVGGVGTRYGQGYSVDHLRSYITRLSLEASEPHLS